MSETKTTKRNRRKAAMVRDEPGYDGGRLLVEETVEDPYRPGQYERAVRNARHDPIEQLYNQRDRKGRRLITFGEREAGRRVRELVDALGLDAVRAIVLDGAGGCSSRGYDFPAHRIDAGRRMAQLRERLGEVMTDVLVRVAGYGEPVTLVAIALERDDENRVNGACSKGAREGTGFLFRIALEHAAAHFGYGEVIGGASRGIRAWQSESPSAAHASRDSLTPPPEGS